METTPRKIRYDACSDIAEATLEILIEYLEDMHTEGVFMCVHEDEPVVEELVDRGYELRREGWPSGYIRGWMHDVADIIEELWD